MHTVGMQPYFKQMEDGPVLEAGAKYKCEAVRLGSFSGWPSECKTRPVNLARIGFYWTHRGDEVKCFSCDAAVRDWVNIDGLEEAHRQAHNNCPMLTCKDKDNIPLLPPAMNKREAEEGLPVIPIPTEGILADILASHVARRQPGNQVNKAFVEHHYLEGLPENNKARVLNGSNLSETVVSLETTDRPRVTNSRRGTLSEEATGQMLMKREEERMKTFINWPARRRVDPVELVKAGLYYFGVSDRVKCAFCHNVLQKWVLGDVPLEEHNKFYPNCPFVQGLSVGNVHAGAEKADGGVNEENTPVITNPSLVDLGIFTGKAKHPRYTLEHRRLGTFGGFPKEGVISSDNLAKAGFFYEGNNDSVQCFFCDGELRNWVQGDNEWVEHARWFPRCGFLRVMKGEEFIRAVQAERDPAIAATLHTSDLNKETGNQTTKQKNKDRCGKAKHDPYATAAVELTSLDTIALTTETHSSPAEAAPTPSTTVYAVQVESGAEQQSDLVGSAVAKELEKENQELKDQRTCKVCMDAEACMVFLPCGHLVCCASCTMHVRQCPICRAVIRGTVHAYLASAPTTTVEVVKEGP